MRKIVSCEFNMDTACVELRLEDGTLLSIDCTAIENEVANSMYQRSELDWLIYNDPLAYAAICYNPIRQEKSPLETVGAVSGGFPHANLIYCTFIIPENWGFVNVGLYF